MTDLVKAVSSVLWVLVPIAALWVLRNVVPDRGSLQSLGIGFSGVTMEFAEQKLEESLHNTGIETKELVGSAALRTVVERAQRLAPSLAEARILWVDDHPEHNTSICQLLRKFGATVDEVRSNETAMRRLIGTRYDVLISDVARDDEGADSNVMGIKLAEEAFHRTGLKTIIFTGRFDPATLPNTSDADRIEMVKRVQRSVFGRTNRSDELLHLVLDQLERK